MTTLSNYILIFPASCLLIACKPSATSTTSEPEKPATTQAAAVDSFLNLPGDYAQKTTVTDLEARFGAANVLRETGENPCVTLFPNDPTRRATITFHEAAELKEFARITVSDSASRWRGKRGVHLGMTLAELVKLNGKHFFLSGFDAQQRARALDGWSPASDDADGGKLGALDVAEGDHLYFEVELGITDPAYLKTVLPTEFQLSSDDPRLLIISEVIEVTAIGASSSLDDEWE